MAIKTYSDNQVLRNQVREYGLLPVLFHYVKQAKNAGDRMNINIQAEKPYVVIAEAQQAVEAINSLYSLMVDDTNIPKDE